MKRVLTAVLAILCALSIVSCSKVADSLGNAAPNLSGSAEISSATGGTVAFNNEVVMSIPAQMFGQ